MLGVIQEIEKDGGIFQVTKTVRLELCVQLYQYILARTGCDQDLVTEQHERTGITHICDILQL